jgi:hypothetical protein
VCECELDATGVAECELGSYETTNRGGVACGMRLLQQITRAAPEAFYQCVCECELDATGVDRGLRYAAVTADN